jgi:hypothetical protein
VSRETSGFIAETKFSKSDAGDLAALVSAADDVEAALGATEAYCPDFV